MKFNFHSLIIKIFSILIFAGFFYSCGVWTNFTTYFNLYYDASDFFNQAEQIIKSQKIDLFSTENLKIPQNANADLQKVIEKCSQILQFHAKSSYVDDALLMLGKSFYYQASYRKALRKFNELIVTQPHSDLILETNLWVGKTQIQLKDYDDGLTTLKSVRKTAIKENDRKIAQESYIEEIKYNLLQTDYIDALNLAEEFLKYSNDDEINAEVAYEMGILYEKSNNLTNAIKSFERVKDYSPNYETLYDSRLELGKALRDNNQFQKALDVFDNMRKEKKYSDSFTDIDLERGITLLKMNKPDEAVSTLLTIDTSKTRTPSQGIAAFQLGGIFKNHYRNFDSALVFYSKTIGSMAPKEYVDTARSNVEMLNKFKTVFNEYKKDQKELEYALNPESFKKDSIAYQMKILSEEEAESAKENHYLGRNAMHDMIIDSSKIKDSTLVRDSLLALDSLRIKDSLNALQNRGYKNNDFQNRNNLAAFNRSSSRGKNIGNINPNDNRVNKTKKEVEKPPVRPKEPVDTLEYWIVKTEFDLGNILFTEFNFPDSAYSYYKNIITKHPNSPFQARVLFAIGSYYLTINDSIKADSLFNIIYDKYKDERIVNAAADKLGKPLVDFNYDPAQFLYISASTQMDSAKYDSSISNFYKIYLTHPQSPYAAKALYTTGWILENKLNMNDSAAVVYDTLIKKYPRSIYAVTVNPKIIFFKSELARIKKAHNDSLKYAGSGKLDSLNANKKNTKGLQNESSKLALNNGENKPNKTPAEIEADKLKIKEFLNRANANLNVNSDTLIRIRGESIKRMER